MLALALAAALFAAEPEPRALERDCNNDYEPKACDAAALASSLRRFDVPSAEALAGQGFEGVRVFMIDGYSRDVPLVSVLQPPVGDAELEVRVPVRGAAPRVMETSISVWTWEVSQTLARMTLASPEAVSSEDMCLHAWSARIEVIAAGKVTTRLRNFCSNDSLFEAASALSPLALGAMGRCDNLKARDPSAQLARCSIISGQSTWDAVEVANLLGGRVFEDYEVEDAEFIDEDIPRSEVARLFSSEANLTWAGSPPAKGPDAAAALWRKQLNEDTFLWIEPRSIEAGASSQVTVRGVITYTEHLENGRERRFEAPFEQKWLRFDAYEMRLYSWTVEPFRQVER